MYVCDMNNNPLSLYMFCIYIYIERDIPNEGLWTVRPGPTSCPHNCPHKEQAQLKENPLKTNTLECRLVNSGCSC